jgi:uncharacterized protein HemX
MDGIRTQAAGILIALMVGLIGLAGCGGMSETVKRLEQRLKAAEDATATLQRQVADLQAQQAQQADEQKELLKEALDSAAQRIAELQHDVARMEPEVEAWSAAKDQLLSMAPSGDMSVPSEPAAQ